MNRLLMLSMATLIFSCAATASSKNNVKLTDNDCLVAWSASSAAKTCDLNSAVAANSDFCTINADCGYYIGGKYYHMNNKQTLLYSEVPQLTNCDGHFTIGSCQ